MQGSKATGHGRGHGGAAVRCGTAPRSRATAPGRDSALVQVFVDGDTDIGQLSERYDVAEYKQVEADGSIQLNIDATRTSGPNCARRAAVGNTIEDAASRAAVAEERDAQRELEALAADYAENGAPKSKAGSPRRVRRSSSAQTGSPTTPARSSTSRRTTRRRRPRAPRRITGPSLALTFAGADGVYGAATTWRA